MAKPTCERCGEKESTHTCPDCEIPVCDDCSAGQGTACFDCENAETPEV